MIGQLISKYIHSEKYYETNGVEFKHTSGKYDIGMMFTAREGEAVSSMNGYEAQFLSLDGKLIDVGMQRTLYEESEKQIFTKPCRGKFVGKMIISPACLADVLKMAFYNFISDSTIIDGTSPWKSMLDKPVASGYPFPQCLLIQGLSVESALPVKDTGVKTWILFKTGC